MFIASNISLYHLLVLGDVTHTEQTVPIMSPSTLKEFGNECKNDQIKFLKIDIKIICLK